MKEKLLSILCSLAMTAALLAGCGGAGAADTGASGGSEAAAGGSGYRIALITMDSIDQHWVTLNEGAQAEAAKEGVTVDFMSPDLKDDSKQIEYVNNAVAGGYDAIMVAANGPDAISGALKEAIAAGVKIVYVDSPANVEAEATFSTNNYAAGKTAGEELIKELENRGVTSGDIGIVNVNASTQSAVDREGGFREAFEGKGYNILETQYCDGDAAKAQNIAENYITQGVVGIYGTNEGSTTGTGNAIKASGNTDIVGVGFDKSDSILGLIKDGYLLCAMAQNPDVMGAKGVEACVKALNGEDLGGAVTDTGVTVLNAAALGGAAAAGGASDDDVTANGDYKIALITMDSIDQHWVTLNEGAQAEAEKHGVTVDFMSPDTKDDSKQIECVNNAVAGGYDAIMVAANGPDAISGALKEAMSAGIKIVYVDSPANVDAEATYSTNNKAAGKTAGEEMIKELESKGITSGDIGIVNVNASTQSTVDREAGFREAFEGKGYNILETQYCDGDAAKAQSIAENYITQGVVGIFGGNEGSTTGTGNAIKASGEEVVGVGFDKSDSILGLVSDGYLLCTMAQNPDVMGAMGVDACIRALNGEDLGGEVVDTGVTVLNASNI
ncbi:MAG: substrate-binding domain-containing protein [Lachnospiraceae bacterium]|nr:substrate-binding domain-containing protein [Lachnospiraceae bacterium]